MLFFAPKDVKIAQKMVKLTLKRVEIDQKLSKLKEKLCTLYDLGCISGSGVYQTAHGTVMIKPNQTLKYDTDKIWKDFKENKLSTANIDSIFSINPNKIGFDPAFKKYYKGLVQKTTALVYITNKKENK